MPRTTHSIRHVVASVTLLLLVCASADSQGFMDVTTLSGTGTPANLLGLLGRGACCGDFDGDGDLDLIAPGGGGLPVYYFRNDGLFVFSDQTATAGLGMTGDPKALTPADVDNDGDLDLFVANLFLPDQLFINDGNGVFTDEGLVRGVASALSSFSASFGDYDRDGLLDLYVGRRHSLVSGGGESNSLYRNLGDGFFMEVTAQAGANNQGFTLAAPFVDFDQDGWPDIFIANDKGTQVFNPPTALLRNNRDGTFTDVSAQMGAQLAIDGMGVDFADVFHRGAVDIFVTDIPQDHHFLVQNLPGVDYLDQGVQRGLAGGLVGWGCHFIDYDNDTWLDLFVVHGTGPNHMYRNPGTGLGGGAWTEHAAALGIDFPTSPFAYAAVVADFDDDGREDIYHALPGFGNRMTRNVTPQANWLKVKLQGTVSNRDALGARVTITVGTDTQTQWVRSGIGYLAGRERRCHFGLGTATTVDRVDVLWPSGQTQSLSNVAINQTLDVTEPSISLLTPPVIGAAPTMLVDVQGDENLPYLIALSLGTSPGLPLSPTRTIPLNPDWLMALGLDIGIPLPNVGLLSPVGKGFVTLPIPNAPNLVNFTFFAGAITADATLADPIKTIVQPLRIQLQ